jgi:hypothetical protein
MGRNPSPAPPYFWHFLSLSLERERRAIEFGGELLFDDKTTYLI